MRDRFGIPGQSEDSAIAFRDKTVMKEKVRQHGILTADFARVDSSFDLLHFVEANGFPIVLKPRDGSGSMNTAVIRDRDALFRYLAQGVAPNMTVETFVPGEMYHIDGLVTG